MGEEGLGEDWDEYLEGRAPAIYAAKASGYLERNVSKEVVRCADILHSSVGVTRSPPLEPTLTRPHKQTWRVFAAELPDEHAATLQAAAASGETVKFRGQQHHVRRCQGGWTKLGNPVSDVYDLQKIK